MGLQHQVLHYYRCCGLEEPVSLLISFYLDFQDGSMLMKVVVLARAEYLYHKTQVSYLLNCSVCQSSR
jgi:hypothetical protein